MSELSKVYNYSTNGSQWRVKKELLTYLIFCLANFAIILNSHWIWLLGGMSIELLYVKHCAISFYCLCCNLLYIFVSLSAV